MGLISRIFKLFQDQDLWAWDSDPWLDQAIEDNKAKPIPGYEKPDHDIMDRIGKGRWDDTERAQRRLGS